MGLIPEDIEANVAWEDVGYGVYEEDVEAIVVQAWPGDGGRDER